MGLPEGRDLFIDREENNKPYVMKNSHIHDYYEVYYLMAGSRRYFINHTLFNMEPGDVVLVNKGDLHLTTMISSEHYYERYLMTFTPLRGFSTSSAPSATRMTNMPTSCPAPTWRN